MRFCSLGSGSSGNCTVIESGNTRVMIDCGFSIKDVVARSQVRELGFALEELAGIFVTHEHSDHAGGAARLARKFNIPVYMGAATAERLRDLDNVEIRIIYDQNPIQLDDLTLTPFTVPHDAKEPLQFVLHSASGLKLGVLSDLGHVPANVVEALHDCDGLLLEANHDTFMLETGPYPPSLKSRVGGHWGHLNNQQSAGLLSKIRRDKLRCLVATHLSEKNNSPEQVRQAWSQTAGIDPDFIIMADQDGGFAWQTLSDSEGTSD